MFLLCFKIFLSRILDVSIGTFRTILIVKGNKKISTILAFFEVFVWYFAARTALLINGMTIIVPIVYSLGYAFGSYIGMILSDIFLKNY